MQNYINYQNLMSSALQDYQKKASEEKEKYESKLLKTEEEKDLIDTATNLATMPFEAVVSKEGIQLLSKGVDKITGGKVTQFNEYINKKLLRAKTNAEKQLGDLKDKFLNRQQQEAEPSEETSENPSGESGEVEPEQVETTQLDPDVEAATQLAEPSQAGFEETGQELTQSLFRTTAGETFDDGLGGTRLFTFREILNDPDTFNAYARQSYPEQTANASDADIEESRQQLLSRDLPDERLNDLEMVDTPETQITESAYRDSLAPMRDELMRRQQEAQQEDEGAEGNSNVDVANNQGSDIATEQVTANESDAVDSASSNAVDSTAENAGIEAGQDTAETAGEVAGEVAGETAEAGAGAALMDNPFTFFIGLAMMIGGIVGGVEGSRSIKNPKPTPIAVPNVSTQFGM